MMRSLIPFALFVAVVGVEVTPIDKVISLLEGMKSDVEKEGAAEAKAYSEFACFCKDTTKTKSDEITKGNDSIDKDSANIADKTQSKKKASTELSERRTQQEKLAADLQSTNTRCAEEKAKYDAEAADMNKALSSLKNAIKAMQDSKPSASLLQGSVQQDLQETLAMADAMNMVTPKRKAITSMIQGTSSVDPSDPEYKYHSNDIVSLLQELETEFKDSKKTLDEEYKKSKKACDEMKASLKKEMSSNSDAMKALDKEIEKLAKEIAGHRGDLVNSEGDMKDNELYLKDLTAQCEARANDYDQRSAMRGSEITALSEALKVLKGDVKGRADAVNQRALIQSLRKPEAKPVPVKGSSTVVQELPAAAKAPEKKAEPASKTVKKHISFLQVLSSDDQRKEKALAFLSTQGEQISSFMLTSFAQRSAADPFKKIKGLIQKLIERLLAEAANEATKKGFCDTELGKARKDRDFRREETQDLSSELAGLEAKRDALTEEIKLLTKQIAAEELALKEATKMRKEENTENLATLKTAKEGLDAVREALLTLRSFYSQAAKAASFSQVSASPVDEDTSGPGFEGNYKGNQSGSKAVLSLLETIESDFDRTIRTTEAAEEAAHRAFVDLSQATKASLGSKTTKKELDEQDLKTTQNSLKTKMADLVSAQGLLDDALKELEDLKPACIDTGMSYAERVKKREQEMEALKKALCILGSDDPSCGMSLN